MVADAAAEAVGAINEVVPPAEGDAEDADLPPEQTCVICLNAKRAVGYLHRDRSMHLVACKQCSTKDRLCRGAVVCPVCMQRASLVDVFS